MAQDWPHPPFDTQPRLHRMILAPIAQFWLQRVPAPVQGALLMLGAALGFSVMAGLIRAASAELHPLQIVFFRNAFALAFMLPWLLSVGGAGLRTGRIKVHVARAVLGLCAMSSWFTAVTLLPLAEAMALNFLVPLFATAAAALLLGELVGARRWTATAVGFLGVLVIVRPGFEAVTAATALPVLAAAFMALAAVTVKSLAHTESPGAIVFYMNLFLTPLSLVPALLVWRWPAESGTWAAVIAVGFLSVIAQQLLTRSYQRADASAVVPFQYARLPFSAAIGYAFFDETPDIWTFVGAAIIAGSAVYIARREAQLARDLP